MDWDRAGRTGTEWEELWERLDWGRKNSLSPRVHVWALQREENKRAVSTGLTEGSGPLGCCCVPSDKLSHRGGDSSTLSLQCGTWIDPKARSRGAVTLSISHIILIESFLQGSCYPHKHMHTHTHTHICTHSSTHSTSQALLQRRVAMWQSLNWWDLRWNKKFLVGFSGKQGRLSWHRPIH